MLGVASALICHEIRAHVEGELSRVGASAGKPGVHIHLLALTAGLHRALAVSVIPVVGHESVVVRGQQMVLLVPFQFAFMGSF